VQERQRKSWSELSPQQRRLVFVLIPVQLGLLAAALRDVVRRPADQLSAPKPLWVAVCFVNIVGPITYFVFGRKRGAGA